jgi:hypothetical protein
MLTIALGVCACGRRGTLVDGCCGWCGQDAPTTIPPADAPPMTVARALALLVAELAEDCPAPLAQRLTLASVAADLCRLAGEDVPASVLAALDTPTHSPVRRLVPTARRGSLLDWESQFHEEPA